MRHPSMFLLGGVFLLVWAPSCSRAQVGLRSAPLTASRTRDNSSTSSLFSSRWTGIDLRHKGNSSSSIESSLAAIFRGVAYGASTSKPSTTTSPTTPLPPPQPTEHYRNQQNLSPRDDYGSKLSGEPSVWSPQSRGEPEVQQRAVLKEQGLSTMLDPPIQTPYMEAPFNTAGDEDFNLETDMAQEETQEVEVMRADVGTGLSKAAWVRGLGRTWVVHVYCAAGLHSLLALLAVLWLARVHVTMHLVPRGYCITIHLLMFLSAFLRCVNLFHDPYGAERRLPMALSAVVEEISWPCLTAALAVIVLAIVRAWRFPCLLLCKPQAPLALALLTASHLFAVVGAHVTSALLPEHAPPLRAAARALTAAWSGAVGVVGFCSVWRVWRAAGRHPGVVRLSRSPLEVTLPPRHPPLVLLRGSYLTLVASLIQVVLAGLHIYALVGPHYIFELPPLYPLYWLVYQSICRLLEVLMWLLLGIASALTIGGTSGKRHNRKGEAKILSVFACRRCGSCSSVVTQDKVDEMFPAVCQSNQAVRNFTLQSGREGRHQDTLTREPLTRRSNTVRISQKRPSLRKSATLHSGTSDIRLLWNQELNKRADPSDASSRPSSMLFNEAGFVRFRMQVDPQQAVDEVLGKSLQNLKIKAEVADSTLRQQIPNDDPPTYDQTFNIIKPQSLNTTAQAKSKKSPRYEEPYDNIRFEQLLQNRISSDLYDGVVEGRQSRSEVASITDYSSTSAFSPVPTADSEWPKYASTCSSISATNSFDVRMYDDLEVSSCYQSPSSVSSHVYASLHRPGPRARLYRQRAVCDDEPASVHGYESRQAVEQLTALLAPRTSSTSPHSGIHINYLTDGLFDPHIRDSDSDVCSSVSCHNHHKHRHVEYLKPSAGIRRKSHPGPPTHHDMTLDSVEVADCAGHATEASADDGEPALMLCIGQTTPPRPGLLAKIVKNNFSLNSNGYSPLGSEDKYNLPLYHQQVLLKQAQQDNLQQDAEETSEKVRACGHRVRKASRDNLKPTSPVMGPSIYRHKHLSPTDQQQQHTRNKMQFSQNQTEPESHHHKDEVSQGVIIINGTTQTVEDKQEWTPVLSPSSSRPASSLASQSELPSECVASDEEIPVECDQPHTPDREVSPTTVNVDSWPSPTRT